MRTIEYPWEKEKREIECRILSVLSTEIFFNFFYILLSFKQEKFKPQSSKQSVTSPSLKNLFFYFYLCWNSIFLYFYIFLQVFFKKKLGIKVHSSPKFDIVDLFGELVKPTRLIVNSKNNRCKILVGDSEKSTGFVCKFE